MTSQPAHDRHKKEHSRHKHKTTKRSKSGSESAPDKHVIIQHIVIVEVSNTVILSGRIGQRCRGS
jgi:hypothetical protein